VRETLQLAHRESRMAFCAGAQSLTSGQPTPIADYSGRSGW
jgi:hypothetical protein